MLRYASTIILLFSSVLGLASCTSVPRYRTFSSAMPATIPPEREEIVRIAESYLGTPYRSGGTSARGVDCSGLVTAVYRSAGLDLPRTSKAQSQAGVRIAPDEIQPGDLVFFATSRSRSVSHVGIYIGNDRFIHASTKARSVCIDSLSLDYFKRRFVTARRVL